MYFVFSLVLVAIYCVFNYFCAKPDPEKGWKGWLTIVIPALVLGGAFHIGNYFLLPTFSYDTASVYLELILFMALTLWFTSFRTMKHSYEGYMFDDAMETPVWQYAFWSALGGVALLIASGIYTWDFFHTSYQQQLLNVVDTIDVKKDTKGATAVFSPIPVEEMCTVSPEVAERVILTKMGDLKNTYYLSPLTKQSFSGHFIAKTFDGKEVKIDYDNHLVYVGILEHKFYWTWNAQKWSPAYVLVNATSGDAYIVGKVNGENIQIRYTHEADPFSTSGANWGYNLERHLRQNGYADVILDDFNFEIDENGRPFAPVTTMKKVIDMFTYDVTGVAVVDVQTGDIKWYTPQDAPKFVNRIYPEWLVYERIINWGEYPNGYFHWDSNEGLLQPCAGMDIVQTKSGCCYYVGIQAKTGTFDTEGYMLVDIRTGVATYYKRDGISEAEAVRVLRTNTYDNISIQVNDSILRLTEPVFYNIEGMNTFFATFVANADLTVKYYAFCSADSKDVVGVGKTLEEAKAAYVDSYHKHIAVKASKLQTTDKRSEVTLEAVVLEKVQEGGAYYFRLEGQEGKTFYTYASIIPEVRWSAKKIKITYNKTDAKLIAISSYQGLD